jgi:putative hydrolase of the HAD superfamily
MDRHWKAHGYFFDLDGTLLRAPEEDFYQTICELGLHFSLEEVYPAYYAAREWYRQHIHTARDGEEIWRSFAGQVFLALGLDPETPGLIESLREGMDRRENDRLFPDTYPVLEQLAQEGSILALISSRPGDGVCAKLDSFGLARFFATVVARENAPAIKPSPLPFLLALERTNLQPSECVYVGDVLEEDVQGAEGVGMRAYLLDRRGRFPPGPKVLRDLYELLRRERIE